MNLFFLRLNPTYLDAVLNIAGVLSDQGRSDEAEKFYKKALSLQPKNADAYNNYAVFLAKTGESKNVIKCSVLFSRDHACP